ncbi:MAG: tetratricopeptide repeat protein, partial [Bdellovibrionaceae bacterium]|nr:tetratricopeptide repeat protein [Pseudobdellovibrionaceae bacterium]
AFKKALDYDSDLLSASENLGALYISAKQYDKAVDVLGRVAEQSALSVGSRLNYAVALTGTGQIDQAVATYEKILKQDSTNKQALANLAIIKIEKQSKFEDGLDLVNRLKFVDSDFGSQDMIKALENKAKAGLK